MGKTRKKNQMKASSNGLRCPYCGSTVILRSADGIYRENSNGTQLYVCSRYPECDAYARVHPGTRNPIGTLANHKLRALRRDAHLYFDQLYLSGLMSKNDAYSWLACVLSVPKSQAHIGYLREYYCQLVIDESKKIIKNKQAQHWQNPMTGGKTA